MTIAVSTIISAFNSLTLSPALTALLVAAAGQRAGSAAAAAGVSRSPAPRWAGFPRPVGNALVGPRLTRCSRSWLPTALACRDGDALDGRRRGRHRRRRSSAGCLGTLFNRLLRVLPRCSTPALPGRRGTTRGSSAACSASAPLVLVVYGGLLGLTYWQLVDTPKGFIPPQDMGYLMCNVQLPDSASMERTEDVMKRLVNIARKTPGVKHAPGITRTVVRAQRRSARTSARCSST